MPERLILVLILVSLGAAAFLAVRAFHLRRVAQRIPHDPLLRDLPRGAKTIVYFTTPHCVPCKTQQQPALRRLQRELGERLHVIQVDATQDADAAQRWGVMTAPTTFVLAEDGRPLYVNYGFADEQTLKRQLSIA
ncbi:MAG: thioredoxin family protein [Anaerolineae bacterium]|nr:thioredoxin family protein [Anaerolineae bacterium]